MMAGSCTGSDKRGLVVGGETLKRGKTTRKRKFLHELYICVLFLIPAQAFV
jgi:hypothetical protein